LPQRLLRGPISRSLSRSDAIIDFNVSQINEAIEIS
jgi:hypothetical protein